MRLPLARLVAICLALALAKPGSALEAEAVRYEFAALGDAPYTMHEEEQFIVMLAEMNRNRLAFVVHVGDFKSGYSPCTDELYLQRRDWFRLSHHPFVYVPGDNEWTDCWRPFVGARDPLERLDKLRELFFDTGDALGQTPLPLVRQTEVAGMPGASYPEHVHWVYGRVAYATLNLPGGDNNRMRMPAESARRTAAARQWIRATFATARERNLPGVVLFMQANPWRRDGLPRPAFADILHDLALEAQNYAGNVLLVHGDTHRFRFGPALSDPVTRRPVENVTRLEVYGSPVVDWVRVHVEVKGDRAAFSVSRGSAFEEPAPGATN